MIEKLRRDQSLRSLPQGGEAIAITVQYQGSVPSESRAGRKEWLQKHFTHLADDWSRTGLKLGPVQSADISTSAQTLRAVVPVGEFDRLVAAASGTAHRVEVVTVHDAELKVAQ